MMMACKRKADDFDASEVKEQERNCAWGDY